jgi:hypothetical protein
MKSAIAILGLLLVASPVAAQSKDQQPQSKDQQQVLALDLAMGKAIEAGDAAAYDKMTTSDFQFINGSGALVSKADRLALLKKGPTAGFRTLDHVIRVYGDVAVVTGRQGGGEGPIRFTRVWLRQGNEWRAVATQATNIEKPKP